MEFSNNQLGRLQLTLATLARLRSRLERTGDIAPARQRLEMVDMVELWPTLSEIDGLADNLKSVYNYGVPVELVPRHATITVDGPWTQNLHDADPHCNHHIVTTLSGVKCTQCHGWFTY